jgi:hypothetical protein
VEEWEAAKVRFDREWEVAVLGGHFTENDGVVSAGDRDKVERGLELEGAGTTPTRRGRANAAA